MTDFYVGKRVTVVGGEAQVVGARGTIIQATHQDAKPHYDWIVRLDEPVRLLGGWREEVAFHERQLDNYTVPEDARPDSGALYHPARESSGVHAREPGFGTPTAGQRGQG